MTHNYKMGMKINRYGLSMLFVLSCFMLLFVRTAHVLAADEEFPWILFYPAITGVAHEKVPYWGPVETITNVGPVAAFDSLMDNKGNVTVVWKYISSTNEYVSFMTKRFDVGSGWSPIEKIETLTVGMSDSIYHSGPKLIMDHMGNINMVWATKSSPATNRVDKFWARRYTKANGWEEKETLYSTANNYPYNCLENSNKDISVCTSKFTVEGFVEGGYIFFKTGDLWRLGGALATRTMYYMEFPDPLPSFLANFGFVDKSGNFILYEVDTQNNTLYASHYSISTDTIIKSVVHNGITSGAYEPQIVRDMTGNATIIWRDFDGNKYNLWANHYTEGGGWGTARIISDEQTGGDILSSLYSKKTHVLVDHLGNVTVIWIQKNDGPTGSNRNLWVNRYQSGTGWGNAELIENISWNVENPLMTLDSQGNITVVWKQYNGQYYRLWSKHHTAISGWGSVQEIPTAFSQRIPKKLIVDKLDNVILIYWLYDTQHIYSMRYTAESGWGNYGWVSGGFSDDVIIHTVLDDSNNITIFMQDASFSSSPIGKYFSGARHSQGTDWYLQQFISPWASKNPHPQIMVDSKGRVTVVFGFMPFPEFLSGINAIQLDYQ